MEESITTDENGDGALTDISMNSEKTSSSSFNSSFSSKNNTDDYNNNMKIFLQCIENISYTDEFDYNNKSNNIDTDDEDQFSDSELLSAFHSGRPVRRRRAATFSHYPEKKKEIRLLSPVKKVELDDDIAARFLMDLKAASANSNNNDSNNCNNQVNQNNVINNNSNKENEVLKFVYRPRSNSLPDLGSKLNSTMSNMAYGETKGGRIGIYSPEARKKRLDRFFEKKKHRVWKRNIKYDVRKNFADSRVRVKGRFVRKDEEIQIREELQED